MTTRETPLTPAQARKGLLLCILGTLLAALALSLWETKRIMGKTQVPSYAEEGPIDSGFRREAALK